MSVIHTRMPVILHEKDWARWLDRTVTEQPPIDLLRPYESDLMEMIQTRTFLAQIAL